MLQWHSFLFHTYHFLSFKKANSHHGRPCKLDLQQNSTISFYSSYPNRKKSIQHFLLSLSEYCPNSFWKQSSVHRFLRKQGRDAHRGRCPYCSSHSARDHWSARPRIVRCRPRPPKTTQTRHRRIARKGCRSCRSEEQVALPKAILPGRSGRPARPKRSLRPPPRNRPRSTMLAVSCARPSSSTKTECRRSDSRRYLPCRFLLRLVRPPWQTQPRQPLACRPSMCRWPWRGWSAPPQPPASRIFARRKRLSLPTIRRVVIARREQTARKQREERCPTATARRQSMK